MLSDADEDASANTARGSIRSPVVAVGYTVPVFVYCSHKNWTLRDIELSNYWPIVATIWEAFEDVGLLVEFVPENKHVELLSRIDEAIKDKVMPIVLLLLWEYVTPRGLYTKRAMESPIQHFGRHGAYVIMYNLQTRDSFLKGMLKLGKQWKVREIWDASASAADVYKLPNGNNKIVRVFPPGCAKRLRLNTLRNPPFRDNWHVSFVGSWTEQPDEKRQLWNASWLIVQQPQHVHVNTHGEWKSYIEERPLQVSLHTDLNHAKAFEALSGAMLLSNGACLFSEHSGLDEVLWKGVVHFVSAEEANHIFRSFSGDPEKIRQCQAEAESRFCWHFSPSRLLHKSGFNEQLRNITSGELFAHVP